jgi:hypothetical protein
MMKLRAFTKSGGFKAYAAHPIAIQTSAIIKRVTTLLSLSQFLIIWYVGSQGHPAWGAPLELSSKMPLSERGRQKHSGDLIPFFTHDNIIY